MMRHKMSVQSKEFEVNCIELELIMFAKYLCLVLMIKVNKIGHSQ